MTSEWVEQLLGILKEGSVKTLLKKRLIVLRGFTITYAGCSFKYEETIDGISNRENFLNYSSDIKF